MASNTTASALPADFSVDSLLEKAGITKRYTDEEWAKKNEETQKAVVVSETVYDVPGTWRDLAQTIDHTLLKLDATEAQIDELCLEAKRDSFKVCTKVFSEALNDMMQFK
jgi:hypothetical protein